MRKREMIALGLMLWQSAALAQSTETHTASAETSKAGGSSTGVIGADPAAPPEYTPLTASERWKLYFVSAYGPEAVFRSAAAAGIRQWEGSPKEWRGGAEAYGERFGSSYAGHIIRKTLEAGAAAALHEDNRYFHSTETGFWKRSKHAVAQFFIARNNAGQEHFAYSRFGSALSASFISRIWQPRSTNTSGDAAVNFSATVAIDAGWNVLREFWPDITRRVGKH